MPGGTLIDALQRAPEHRPFVIRWMDDDEVSTVTFGQFREFAAVYAGFLQAHQVEAGERVILMLPQGVALMAAFVGAMMLGAIPSILAYPHRKLDPIKFKSGLSGVSGNLRARTVLIDREFPLDLLDALTKTTEVHTLSADLDDVISRYPPACAVKVPSDQVAFIQHSAGTTGLQKGVALSHGAVLRQIEHLAEVLKIDDRDRVYSWLPLYHDMGLVACFMLPMVCHLPVVLQDPMEWVTQPATMLRVMSSQECSLAWLPNFAFQLIARRVREDDGVGVDLSCVRALISCSEPIRPAALDEFLTTTGRLGLRADAIQTSYAMAENTFAVTQSVLGQRVARVWIDGDRLRSHGETVEVAAEAANALCLVSSGRCLSANQTRVVNEHGDEVGDGRVGAIHVRSDSLFDGYDHRPDLTALALNGGWYRTGDRGFRIGPDHFVIGRHSDMIVTAGKNIYPEDIEEAVCAHPAIHSGRAVALGVYNPAAGTEEIVVAAEVHDVPALAEAESIAREIRQAVIAEFGVSVRAVFVKPPRWIVKSTAGKSARSDTRRRLMAEHPELNPEEREWSNGT